MWRAVASPSTTTPWASTRDQAASDAYDHWGGGTDYAMEQWTQRCGPWVEDVCLKCGAFDPLDTVDLTDR